MDSGRKKHSGKIWSTQYKGFTHSFACTMYTAWHYDYYIYWYAVDSLQCIGYHAIWSMHTYMQILYLDVQSTGPGQRKVAWCPGSIILYSQWMKHSHMICGHWMIISCTSHPCFHVYYLRVMCSLLVHFEYFSYYKLCTQYYGCKIHTTYTLYMQYTS